MIGKKVILITLFLLVSSAIASCKFLQVKILTNKDVVGVWRQDSEDCESDLPNCAKFEFMDDGHFQATSIPIEYFGYIDLSSQDIFDATGEWKIELNPDPLGADKINLQFDPIPEMDYPIYNDVLYASRRIGNPHLFAWHGDPSNRITFLLGTGKDESELRVWGQQP